MRRPSLIVRWTALLATAAYSAVLYVQGVQLDAPLQRLLSAIPVVLVVLLWIWDVWLWHLPVAQSITKRPYIKGLWRVTITPDAEAHIPPGGNRGPIEAYLVVRQTYWSTNVVQFTRESRSESGAVSWEGAELGVARLSFAYRNVPRVSESSRSVRSNGVSDIRTEILNPKVIEGSYYTDRYTKGDVELVFVDRSVEYGRFEDAQRHALEVLGE